MNLLANSISTAILAPPVLMAVAALVCLNRGTTTRLLWKTFTALAGLALLSTLMPALVQVIQPSVASQISLLPGLIAKPTQSWLALLVQFLGTVIGVFSARYLQGEEGQARYIAAFSGVLAAVHMLLLADHWLVLIAAWALIGMLLQHLLCFYEERPFAILAAHKKCFADRVADGLLIAAAALAWTEVGSGSLSELSRHLEHTEISLLLQLSAVCLVLAVIVRTALFPMHGWLIQVMEAPTPVSALLHAGVVNLAGFVLIRFSALLDVATAARWLLVIFGLGTAILAGFVMLTRISIKVRLAWSTVAQMGFMVLECGLGLYTLAFMHLLGHSLYKAHAFLSASGVVQQSKLQQLQGNRPVSAVSMVLAPVAVISLMLLVNKFVLSAGWPWWWSAILAFAWSPLMWSASGVNQQIRHLLFGAAMVTLMTLLISLLHQLPFGINDMANPETGIFALTGMALMYVTLVMLQLYPERLAALQRWSYAGFYVDEAYTRLTLKFWPIDWAYSEKMPAKSWAAR